ncbi:TolC family protein [Magnetococcus marinus]|uniref:TolC family protein n=1 Tax=Magnetococcus marinus TaxID=1124597 RepID=UPI00135F1388|nr:TolC family protein [Magnetococcus marinus]
MLRLTLAMGLSLSAVSAQSAASTTPPIQTPSERLVAAADLPNMVGEAIQAAPAQPPAEKGEQAQSADENVVIPTPPANQQPPGAIAEFAVSSWCAGAGSVIAPSPEQPHMTLGQLIGLLQRHNATLQTKQLAQQSAEAAVQRAKGVFDPLVSFSLKRSHQEEPNNIEEKLTRYTSIYKTDSTAVSMSMSKLFSSGLQLEAEVSETKLMTSTMKTLDANEPDNHRASYSLSVTQPLLRDARSSVVEAPVRAAELGHKAAEHERLDTQSMVTAEAVIAYHDLVLAQHKVAAMQEKIAMANRLLGMAEDLYKKGRLPQSDVWEVENSLSRFETALAEAQQGQREQSNRLRTMIMQSQGEDLGVLQVADVLPKKISNLPTLTESVEQAYAKRQDLKAKRMLLKQQDEQLGYSENQMLPRLDLVASYGRSGLAYDGLDAFEGMKDLSPSWSLGVQASVTLNGNKQAKADVQSARAKREEAALAVKSLEVTITNDIDTSLNALKSACKRWKYWDKVANREEQRVVMEKDRVKAGRSDVRQLLLSEERAIDARQVLKEQQVAFAKAQALLATAQGTLLEQFH